MDPVTFCERNNLSPMQFSIIKYAFRVFNKNGLEDIQKAIHFCIMICREHYNTDVEVKYLDVNTSPGNHVLTETWNGDMTGFQIAIHAHGELVLKWGRHLDDYHITKAEALNKLEELNNGH